MNESPPPDADETEALRKEEVLNAALSLVSERGIAGASLRRLAKRLNLSQPSLYHYFASKDDLIDQLAERGAAHMVDSMKLAELPRVPLERLPHVVKDRIFELWKGDEHLMYSRFLFVLAIESPRHQALIRRVFEQRLLNETSAELSALWCENPALAERLIHGLTMLARALGLALIEERLLFGLEEPSDRLRAHADFIANATTLAILHPAEG